MTATSTPPSTLGSRYRRSSGAVAEVPRAPRTALPQSDFQVIAQHMYSLMLRNVASDGFTITDPTDPTRFSRAGCIIAAPSFPASLPGIDEDYVFNWVRDSAITVMELVAAAMPNRPGGAVQPLVDYVDFATLCQQNATPTKGHACFTIEGESRPWTEQSDGPALQTLAMLQAFPQLDGPAQALALSAMDTNVRYILEVYKQPTTNLWEEHSGYSFFARSVQLRCLQEVTSNSFGVAVPSGTSDAVAWLQSALAEHWNGSIYLSLLAEGSTPTPVVAGYDPNIDIVQASVYGAIPCTDTRLLATTAALRQQWEDAGSPVAYPINQADAAVAMGPLFGRYPGDTYDGDVSNPVPGGHPWGLCTCNVAELHYRLARDIRSNRRVPLDELSRSFFTRIGVSDSTPAADAAAALEAAGDAMLRAVVYHSDNLELSEQFDGTSGYEKSVRNLTWSYAAFLSAVRAKTATHVEG